jgi:hypothetical protein
VKADRADEIANEVKGSMIMEMDRIKSQIKKPKVRNPINDGNVTRRLIENGRHQWAAEKTGQQ